MGDLNTQTQPAPDNVHDLLYPTDRMTEIVGTAQGSVDQAISNGLARAATTLHSLDWFEVVQIRGSIRDGSVHQTQVTMKVGFRVDD